MTTPPPPIGTTQKPRSRRGCLLTGCISLVLIAIIVPIVVYFYASHRVKQVIENYTSTKRAVFPELVLSARQTAQLEERLARFQAELQAGRQPEPFTLTGDDLNALIARQAWLYDKVRVSFSNNTANVQLSVPLQGMPIPLFQERLRGRYLNATAALGLALTNGTLDINVLTATFNSKTPPDEMKQRVDDALSNSSIVKDARTREMMKRLQSVSVKDGFMILQPGAPPR